MRRPFFYFHLSVGPNQIKNIQSLNCLYFLIVLVDTLIQRVLWMKPFAGFRKVFKPKLQIFLDLWFYFIKIFYCPLTKGKRPKTGNTKKAQFL